MNDIDGVLTSLVELAHRIGADRSLVLHGGGNISAKTTGLDHLGRERPLLVVKGSGADMRTMDATGFTALFLDDLMTLRQRDAMNDEEMVAFLSHTFADSRAPRPSIETLLHGFRSERYVIHVHADAICALTNTQGARELVAEALGADVPVIGYVRPGFELAKRVSELSGDAVVLAHHGLVTWNDDLKLCLERTLELQRRAERFVGERIATRPRTVTTVRPANAASIEELLIALRKRLSRDNRVVLALEPHGRAVADRPDIDRVAIAGPATADHLLRTRPWSAVVRDGADVDRVIDAWEQSYAGLVTRYQDRMPPGTGRRDATPAVVLVPGVGLIARGVDARDARMTAEVAMHTHSVAANALDAFGDVEPLPEMDLFDIEYWPLELAKLKPVPSSDLARRIVVVTGAASGIGRDTAVALAKAGAMVAITDRDAVGLDETAQAITAIGVAPLAITGDITDADVIDRFIHATILSFGGIDGVVSNAGVATTGRIAELSDEDWAKSLAVNATAHFLLVRRVLPVLERQGLGGSVVFVASKNAFSPGAGFGAYSVAKAAEVQLARLVAIEGGSHGIRANVVNPDAVFEGSNLWDTSLRRERATSHGVSVDRLEQFYADRSLLRRSVRTSDVAEAIMFCLSDRSSRTTGCVITVDAGVPAAFPR